MTRRIDADHKYFRKVIERKVRKSLDRYIDKGSIFRNKPKGGKIVIPIDQIHQPKLVYGDNKIGVGRGPGNKGDVIRRDPQQGKGGNQAGEEHADGVEVVVDLDAVLRAIGEDLELPNLKPKESNLEEIEYKYCSISKTGPNSLRHTRKTLMQALKRRIMSGEDDVLYQLPGFRESVQLISPISEDFRYRQYKEFRKPVSNAVIFFARDCSGSMGDAKCEIVSDISWWLDLWIRRFYKRTERIYTIHDTEAEICDEDKFYRYRHGGGTRCSSSLKLINQEIKNRFPPHKWNIYLFYFSDGDNIDHDNAEFCRVLKEDLTPQIVNLTGITQVLCWNYKFSLKKSIDTELSSGGLRPEFVRTVSVGSEEEKKGYSISGGTLTDEQRDQYTKRVLKSLLGKLEKAGK